MTLVLWINLLNRALLMFMQHQFKSVWHSSKCLKSSSKCLVKSSSNVMSLFNSIASFQAFLFPNFLCCEHFLNTNHVCFLLNKGFFKNNFHDLLTFLQKYILCELKVKFKKISSAIWCNPGQLIKFSMIFNLRMWFVSFYWNEIMCNFAIMC